MVAAKELATIHMKEVSKTYEQVEEDEFVFFQKLEKNDYYYKDPTPEVSTTMMMIIICVYFVNIYSLIRYSYNSLEDPT